jgi:hypothetical protein
MTDLHSSVYLTLKKDGALEVLVLAFVQSGALETISRGQLSHLFLVPYLAINYAKARKTAEIIEDHSDAALIHLAKNYVEAAGARFVFLTFDRLTQIGQKTEIEATIANAHKRAVADPAGYRSWLTQCPDHIREMYADIPHFSPDYWSEILFGPGNMIKNARVTLKPHKSDYINLMIRLEADLC